MKITLMLPRGPLYEYKKGIFKKPIMAAPLTLTILASVIPEDLNAEVELIDGGIQEIPEDVDADIVGITAITGTANRAYNIADRLRKKGKTVILGGVHPSLMPDEAINHADSVVVGFAEKTFPQLLRDFKNNKLKRFYHYNEDDNILKNLPIPRRDLLPEDKFVTINTVMATRGCLSRCEFCTIPALRKKKMYFRPIKEVVREIEQLKGKKIMFYDPSPTDDLEYAKKLFREMIPLKKLWVSCVKINLAKDKELLDLAVKSGCRGVLLGIESINQDSLIGIEKGFNKVNNYKEDIRKLQDNGINVAGSLVLGLDSDDRSTFDRTVEFTIDAKLDLVRYGVCTPFPGTPLYKKFNRANRIIDNNWEHYDGQHVVYKPVKMTPTELTEGLQLCWKETYKYSSIAKRTRYFDKYFVRRLLANFGYKYWADNFEKFHAEELKMSYENNRQIQNVY